jgi:hypothetical protein
MKDMKYIKCRWLLAMIMSCSLFSCTNLDEEVFDRVDAGIYYQDETSVQGAVAAIYSKAAYSYLEYFWYLQEFSADQVAWRSWNGGLWGWDEALKFALSSHTWTSESTIIRQTWENAWTTIGLCNTLITDLQAISPASIRMTEDALNSYIAEVRTLRAWAYYNIFEIWGGALPLNISSGAEIPGSADTDFDKGCKIIYDFISQELDESVTDLMKEDGSGKTRNRMNQAANRMIKMRLLLNSEVFIKQNSYNECATLCQKILNGDYGTYSITDDGIEIRCSLLMQGCMYVCGTSQIIKQIELNENAEKQKCDDYSLKLYFADLKIAHYIVLFLGLHLTVQKSEPVTPECGIL